MGHVQVRRGFTLIELLVVIAIVAILMGVLLPSLGRARASARAIQTASNLRSVGQGVASYTATQEFYPPSYVYASSPTGTRWRLADQQETNPNPSNGYVHWSWSLFSGGSTPGQAFSSPTTVSGGAPRTNPGRNTEDWENWQRNDLGQGPGSVAPEDRQVKRMAFTGNAAIFPRNKFNLGGNRRKNRLVNVGRVQAMSRTIIATEFLERNNWQSISIDLKSKSHRPVTPFWGGGSGTAVYDEATGGSRPRFFYARESMIKDLGLLGNSAIDDSDSTLNAVGRQQPGGTANFVFADNHVERMTVLESVQRRLWGDKFYSLTGNNVKVFMDSKFK